jgi:hypothetical protein
MDRIDYWFLDSAIEEIVGFGWIIPDEKYGNLAINRTPLSLGIDEIADVLHRLFQEEILLAINPTDLHKINTQIECDSILSTKGFAPLHKEIKAALKQEESLAYFLTKKGGELWESVSHPQWDKYISWLMGDENQILRCGNTNLAKKLLKIEHLLDAGGSFYSPIITTIEWKVFTPWYPNYWKQLTCGYEISYQVNCIDIDDEDENNDCKLIEEKEKAEKFIYDIRNNWYINYFKKN